MTTVHRIMQVDFDGSTVSREEMREFVETVERHLKGQKSSAKAAELLGVLSARQCNEYLQDDGQAEAMRRGFRLALNLAKFDFPAVQRELRRERQRESANSRTGNVDDRNAQIVAEFLEMRKRTPEHKCAAKLAKGHKVAPRTIRDIIRPYRDN